MYKKDKILIGIFIVLAIFVIIVFTTNSNKSNKESKNINNVNELELKVTPSGKPNNNFIQNLINKKM